MPALLVNVQREWHAGLAQCGGEKKTVLHRHRAILGCMPDEGGRGVFANLFFAGEQVDEFLRRIVAEQVSLRALMGVFAHGDHRVTKDAGVGSRAGAVDRVTCLGVAIVKMGDRGGSEVSAG